MKVAFFGTSNRSEHILEALHKNFDLALCVTKSNRIVGRAKEEKETVVKEWAQNHNIPVFEIEKMKMAEEALLKELITREIDLIVVADFGFIITKSIISEFENRIINIHFSLLPKYRGANPVQAAIINGDSITGITFLQMVYELDAGDIIFQIPYPLNHTETSGEIYKILFEKAAQELPEVLKKYLDNTVKMEKQDQEEATYYYSPSHPKSTYIYKEDAKINWQESLSQIERKIRAFNPWPIAWASLEELENAGICRLKQGVNKKLIIKIYSSKISAEKLEPISVQVEGKKITDWKSFENGYCQK